MDRVVFLQGKRNEYIHALGATFHHDSASDLVRISNYPGLKQFVEDYIAMCCIPEFREEYKKLSTGPKGRDFFEEFLDESHPDFPRPTAKVTTSGLQTQVKDPAKALTGTTH